MAGSLEGKVALVTGASSGIGETTAKALSKRGHPLLLLARRIERLEAMRLPNALCRETDVTDLEAFKKAVTEAEDQYRPTDCLINNAGVMLLSQIVDQNPAEWKNMIDVNVLGILNGIHSVLEGMIERRTGTIMRGRRRRRPSVSSRGVWTEVEMVSRWAVTWGTIR